MTAGPVMRRGDVRAALLVLALLAAAALLAPWVAPAPRDRIDLEHRNQPPSAAHPFGTDALGRDVLSRLLHGGRVSLAVAVLSTLLAAAIGTALGLYAGYRGGRADAWISHAVDAALAVPIFFVLLVLGSWWGARLGTLCLVIGLASWMPVARLVRGTVLTLRERPYVEAARSLGFGTPRILVLHVLPNALAPIGVAAALAAAQAILVESALGFLGFGLQPPTPSWGNMLQEAQAHFHTAPWLAMFPGAAIFVTVLCLHALADATRDALDPHR